ncbi:MAG: DUF1998 domain-containing protein [Anaerolineales bacterium]|nr:DUF1998 domain-containing protein [Anaerolineales bacterium]
MATAAPRYTRVGEVRPSQLMYAYGVGAIVDLPKLSVIVTGLEDWPADRQSGVREIVEERLLTAVRSRLPTVERLLSAPMLPDGDVPTSPFEDAARIGVPVAAFPRWMVCPRCQLLAPLNSGLFDLDENLYFPDRTVYRHTTCNKAAKPDVIPARFLAACEKGHLDDFPWVEFAHRGQPCEGWLLRLIELGPSGEARDLEVRCETCQARRRLSEAFGEDNRENMPPCRGRRPHLRDFDLEPCENLMRPLILGASNTWFPVVLGSIAIPPEGSQLAQVIEAEWSNLNDVASADDIKFMRRRAMLGPLTTYLDDEIWAAIRQRRDRAAQGESTTQRPDLKAPEWRVLTRFDPRLNTDDFRLQPVVPPPQFAAAIQQVVLVERLREVRAMMGFTRLDSFGELNDPDLEEMTEPAPLSRRAPAWLPASEVRGEGLFIQFHEHALARWLGQPAVSARAGEFFAAHKAWRGARRLDPPENSFPGMRFILLHTFAHVLMRQLSLECGYTAASLRERLYSRGPDDPDGPMAGILIYTSAPDSEGTLGGLVSLGEPAVLERHVTLALEAARLCASDPLCAENPPGLRGQTLHAAACHACLFAPETSCERGNKYLDRSTLVKTVEREDLAFFP